MKKEETNPDLVLGRVLSIQGERILVSYKNNVYPSVLRGILKREETESSSLIVPGDFVIFHPQEGRIVSIEPRKTQLLRTRQQKQQCIGANVEQLLIIVSLVSPPLKPALIDRYIIAAHKGKMEPIIVINKIDLLQEGSKEEALYNQVVAIYQKLGVPLLSISATTGEGISFLMAVMKDKTSLLSGQSGVGKSSLLNRMAGFTLPTGKVREKPRKGAHTTTRAELLPLPFGGFCIDTPGIRSFALWELTMQDLWDYFPEITHVKKRCRYPNCTHTHEPHCAVHEAVERREIDPLRFASLLKLQEEVMP